MTEPTKHHRDRCCCPTQSDGAMVVTPHTSSSLATLLAHHALRDGETILLAIKPSVWFILLSSLRFIAAVLIAACALALLDQLASQRLLIGEATLFLIFGRLTIATMQWMSRLYVLTDQRMLRVQGIFQPDVFDCPLRSVSRVDLFHSTRERIFRLGTIVIQPVAGPTAQWQMISRPKQVFARVMDAIHRGQNSGGKVFAAA